MDGPRGITGKVYYRMNGLIMNQICHTSIHRLFTTRSTPLPVMYGVLDVSCMRFGVLDINHSKITTMLRYVYIKYLFVGSYQA